MKKFDALRESIVGQIMSSKELDTMMKDIGYAYREGFFNGKKGAATYFVIAKPRILKRLGSELIVHYTAFEVEDDTPIFIRIDDLERKPFPIHPWYSNQFIIIWITSKKQPKLLSIE